MSDLCLKLSMCIKFTNMMIINVLANCYFPMQNVYFPTQTIFVLCKSLYINGEFF